MWKKIKEFFEEMYWVPKIAFRSMAGNYYIFRDAPLHVVHTFAFCDDNKDDPEFEDVLHEAMREWNLRLDLRERAMNNFLNRPGCPDDIKNDLLAAIERFKGYRCCK